jgi:hypothetical protein
LIRRAIKEFESGALDELLVHMLLHLGRESPKFQQEYIRLRVESWLKPRRSSIPWNATGAITNKTNEQESYSHVLPVGPPLHLIRRATKEFESGLLDEILIHKLLPLNRESPEFRQEYVRLRVQSLLRPRASSEPWFEMVGIASNTVEQVMPEEDNSKNPWSVDTHKDLWIFFGPWLSVLFIIQLFYSFELGALYKTHVLLDGNIPLNITTLIIALVSMFTSYFVLFRCRGQHYKKFIPRLLGLGIASTAIAAASFLLLKFL